MVYSTIALVLQGYPLDHPVLAAAIAGLDAFALEDDHGRRIEACQSPVWDTALAAIALADAGTPSDDPAIEDGQGLALGKRGDRRGRLVVRRPGLAPGGCGAFQFARTSITPTSMTPLRWSSLFAVPSPTPADDAACPRRAVDWVAGMQSSDGGWGAFDADNNSELPLQLPFFDFGAVTDPPTADVTAHVVEMLAGEPGPLNAPSLRGSFGPGPPMAGRQPGAGRLLLGTLGGQLRVRDGGDPARPDRGRRTGPGPESG